MNNYKNLCDLCSISLFEAHTILTMPSPHMFTIFRDIEKEVIAFLTPVHLDTSSLMHSSMNLWEWRIFCNLMVCLECACRINLECMCAWILIQTDVTIIVDMFLLMRRILAHGPEFSFAVLALVFRQQSVHVHMVFEQWEFLETEQNKTNMTLIFE